MKKSNLYKSFSLGTVTLVGLLLSNCATVTPQSRIEKNPDIYESLPSEHQELVKQRQLAEGMSKNAVFLAWGKADRESDSFKDGKKSSTWYYTTSSPTYSHHVSVGSRYNYSPYYGSRYGSRSYSRGYSRGHSRGYSRNRYHGGFGSFGHSGIGTHVSYRRTDLASVSFENGKVSSWEKLR